MKGKTQFGTLFFIILLTLLLFACRSTAPEATSLPVKDTPSPSASPTPTQSETSHPTQTPSITTTQIPTRVKPLEQVLLTDYFATPSPTFNAKTVITATPGIVQACPILDDEIEFDHDFFVDYDTEIVEKENFLLDYLNRGGNVQSVLDVYSNTPGYDHAIYQDVTGDGVPELMLSLRRSFPVNYNIIGCRNGEYRNLYSLDLQGTMNVFYIQIEDLNLDNIPEIYFHLVSQSSNSSWTGYKVISWNGGSFENQITQTEFNNPFVWGTCWDSLVGMHGYSKYAAWDSDQEEVSDIDNNGTIEMLISGGIPFTLAMKTYGPAQSITQTYMWNGEGFVLNDFLFGPPEYRFQVVQNGDLYTLMHKYDRAYEAYRQAIDDPQLEWWSEERSAYYSEYAIATFYDTGNPIPTLPPKDEHEHAYLAAYAQFRIILLDVIQGDTAAALEECRSMQEKYQPGEDGYAYLLYTTAFLDAYQSSGDILIGCRAAYDFGIEHEEELLQYVKGNPRGQSVLYTLDSLCPFK